MERQRENSNLDTIVIRNPFRHISHINDTELSEYVWALKANGTDYHLKWSIKSCAS